MWKSCFRLGKDKKAVFESVTAKILEEGEIHDEGAMWYPGKNCYTVMRPVIVVALLVTLDAMVLSPVVAQMTADLGGSSADSFWSGAAYLLTCAIFQPFLASVSEIFGKKEMLKFSIFVFLFGTWICAPLALNFAFLIIGRSFQGIGSGGIIAMNQVIFSGAVTLRIRPVYFFCLVGLWAFGNIMSPFMGGLFVEHLSWKYCFYVNFMLCGLGFLIVPEFVNFKPEESTLTSKLRRADWVGGAILIGGAAMFIVGLSVAGVQYDWMSAPPWVLTILGLVILAAGILWELRNAMRPFLRVSLFTSTSAIIIYFCAFCQGVLLLVALVYIPFYFSAVLSKSPSQAGLGLFPMIIMLLPGTISVALLVPRFGHFRSAIWTGWTITAAGSGLLLVLDERTGTAVWIPILALLGLGNGIVLTGLNIGIQKVSRAADRPQAAAMYAFFRTLGLSIGLAAGSNVFRVALAAGLRKVSLPENIAKHAEAVAGKLDTLEPDDPMRIDALRAYVDGFHGVFWLMFVVALAALLACLFLKSPCSEETADPNPNILSAGRGMTLSCDRDRLSSSISKEGHIRSGRFSSWRKSLSSPQISDRSNNGHGPAGSISARTPTPFEDSPATALFVFPDGRRVQADVAFQTPLLDGSPQRPQAAFSNQLHVHVGRQWV